MASLLSVILAYKYFTGIIKLVAQCSHSLLNVLGFSFVCCMAESWYRKVMLLTESSLGQGKEVSVLSL